MCASLRRERLARRSQQPPSGSLSGTLPCASEPALPMRHSKEGQCPFVARLQTCLEHLLCARRSLCGANFSKVGFLNKGISSLFFFATEMTSKSCPHIFIDACKSALTWFLFLPTWEPGTPAHPSPCTHPGVDTDSLSRNKAQAQAGKEWLYLGTCCWQSWQGGGG